LRRGPGGGTVRRARRVGCAPVMLSRIASAALVGLDAHPVEVEVDIALGLPAFSIVGLPDAAVKESRERVQAALKNSGLRLPVKRITVNLAPADMRKEGSAFDLPSAVGILVADGAVRPDGAHGYMIVGELALDGRVKPVRGALSLAIAAGRMGLKGIILPAENAREAAVARAVPVYPVNALPELVALLNGEGGPEPIAPDTVATALGPAISDGDFADVAGQSVAKRALQVAAAGGHNVLMSGPPGSGKSMLARRLAGILPPPSLDEAVEVTRIHSVAGILPPGTGLLPSRPYRSPHHTISDVGLIGGGAIPRPGEVSLAHNGVLFMDELPEFRRTVLEVLRQPLEDGTVTISRAAAAVSYPARFLLVAAMNPCPCGYLGDPAHACRCSPREVARYRARISGPLLDRIDIHVEVPAVPADELMGRGGETTSAELAEAVAKARERQAARLGADRPNVRMTGDEIARDCRLDRRGEDLIKRAVTGLGLSARAYHRTLKVARTIADLEGAAEVGTAHLAEAIQYRNAQAGA
jgi:magnesium chelatase family protein